MTEWLHQLAALNCESGESSLFGLPAWHKYLTETVTESGCSVGIEKLTDIWLVVLAVLEIMTRLAGYIAVVFILYGAFTYVHSQGSPDKLAQAWDTIRMALIGLVLAVAATGIVTFVAGRF